jgi:hypothetical protein
MATTTTLRTAPTVFGTIWIAFGINALLHPFYALSFFELYLPSSSTSSFEILTLVQALMIIYGARDIVVGVAIYAAAYFGSNKALG